MDWLQKETEEYSAQSSRKLNMEDGESLDEEPALKLSRNMRPPQHIPRIMLIDRCTVE